MAQKLFTDKIGTLSHSAGNIQMLASLSNPAYLTIGGQQYKITSTLVVALPAMSANTRYQVFAVQSGGVVSLVISQNENSVGPAGYNRWKLVGSLYSNGLSSVGFGSFVNITGVPVSNTWEYTPSYSSSSGGAVVGSIILNKLFLKRIGDQCFAEWIFRQGTGGTAGSGVYLVSLGLVADSNKAKIGASTSLGDQGSGRMNLQGGTGETDGFIYLWDVNNFAYAGGDEATGITSWANTFGPLSTSDLDGGASFSFPVQNWSNTPIEDL